MAMTDLRGLGKNKECSGGKVKFLQPDCPDQVLSHIDSSEAWEDTLVYVGKLVYVIWGSIGICSLK